MEGQEQQKLPADIWALGFVSLCMDISSEMIHALLPVFLVTVLGTSTLTVGIIEGVGEAAASVTKMFSGWLSDRIGKRKALALTGYAIGAMSKPLFALAPAASWVLVARFSDRIGKGIRGAPRDALIGDLAPPGLRGAAYGLRQSLDTVGAFAGPLLAIALMVLSSDDFRLVFWLAVVPALVSVGILAVAVREPGHPAPQSVARSAVLWRQLGELGGRFRGVVIVGAILTLARFSEAFLILRAEDKGLPLAWVPAVLVVMNIIYAFSAFPMGALSDKADRRVILTGGFVVLIVADIVLAVAPNFWVVMLGAGLWGLHMGMTQGLLATLVAETAPPSLRGSAFGLFHLVTGIALLAASFIAGALWDRVGPPATFIAGAAFTAVGLAGAIVLINEAGASSGR